MVFAWSPLMGWKFGGEFRCNGELRCLVTWPPLWVGSILGIYRDKSMQQTCSRHAAWVPHRSPLGLRLVSPVPSTRVLSPHAGQSRPNSGAAFQVNALQTFELSCRFSRQRLVDAWLWISMRFIHTHTMVGVPHRPLQPSLPTHTPCGLATPRSEREGNNVKGFEGLCLNNGSRQGPWPSYVCRVCPPAA